MTDEPADISNWKASVNRDALKLVDTIQSNESRLRAADVELAVATVGVALTVVGCDEKTVSSDRGSEAGVAVVIGDDVAGRA